jgi:hypothetical protein
VEWIWGSPHVLLFLVFISNYSYFPRSYYLLYSIMKSNHTHTHRYIENNKQKCTASAALVEEPEKVRASRGVLGGCGRTSTSVRRCTTRSSPSPTKGDPPSRRPSPSTSSPHSSVEWPCTKSLRPLEFSRQVESNAECVWSKTEEVRAPLLTGQPGPEGVLAQRDLSLMSHQLFLQVPIGSLSRRKGPS